MEALYVQPYEEPRVMSENEGDGKIGSEQDDEGCEALSLASSTTEEETDEDAEPEPPPVLRRKVSFADAFGLDLVSVKEFDNAEVAGVQQRNGDAEENTKDTVSTNVVAADAEAAHKAEKSGGERVDTAGKPVHVEEQKPWVESVKSRRRATRLARVNDYLLKTRPQQPKACSHDSAPGQTVSQHTPAPRGDSIHKCQNIQSSESPQVLTYHQIPLLTLDWNNHPPGSSGTADVDDILTGRPKVTLSNPSKEKSVNDMWKKTDENSSKGTSVSDVWQVFLNGPSCKDRSDVPESEWLQTAASVSPSNDKEPQIQYSAESREFRDFQARTDTPTASHTFAACQPLSGSCEPLSALNSKDYQPEEACVSSPGDDNTATQDASQRSETNPVTDTPLESTLKRAASLSDDSDSPAECHKHEVWDQESEGIIASGIGGDEPFTLHTADLVTSSGESQTTDMTAMQESHNASTVDRISQGARQDEGLSSNWEREVTGTAHNAVDDMLAFRETVRQETKDGARYVFSAARQGVEEAITMNYMESKVSKEVEIFGLKETIKCVDEVQGKEFGCYQNGDHPCQTYDRVSLTKGVEHGPENKAEEKEVVENSEELAQTDQNDDLKSETGQQVLNQSREEKAMEIKEITASAKVTSMVDATESENGSQIIHETPIACPIACPMGKSNSKHLEVVELRWNHSQQELKSRKDEISCEISAEEVTAKQNAAKSDTSTERQPEASGGTEEDLSREHESISIGKLKIEAIREMMGNAESPRGGGENAWKEQESSAEVESSPCGEHKKLSNGAKDPITAGNSAALEEARLEMDFIERFGENLATKIWEGVFVQEPSSTLKNTADEVRMRLTDTTQSCHLLFDEDTFDSGVFSFTELPTDPNWSISEGLEPTIAIESNEYPPKQRSQSLNVAEQNISELHSDLDSSAHHSPDLSGALAARNVEPLFESAQAFFSPKDQGNCSQIKARSVTRLEADAQMEDYVFARKDSLDRSSQQLHPSSEKLKQSDALLWWTVLYTISHITRLLICTLLVGGFFVVVFVYDFPAFFALYIFSVCWWVYTWKRHRMTVANGMTG
uniref:Protein phosphatase 1, regulatory subunit 3Aa n=1 Tax=Nothobranchius furzeri TaxID=105023 RepID=A0A1A8B2I3_NOTFU